MASKLSSEMLAAIDAATREVTELKIGPEQLASEEYRSQKPNAVEVFIRKYMKFSHTFERKALEIAFLGLDRSAGLRVLDLGAGGGHFCYLANKLGHDATALTSPEPPMFANLGEAMGVRVVRQWIDLEKPLDVTGRFDLICASRIKFLESANSPWFEAGFNKFFDHLEQDVLAPGGGFYFLFNLVGEDRLLVAPPEVQEKHRELQRLMLSRGLQQVDFGLYMSPHLAPKSETSTSVKKTRRNTTSHRRSGSIRESL